MPDRQALLFANEAFYRAFADRDVDAMDEVWSRTASVTCIHPGWGVIDERDDVLESWAAIIANPESLEIECRNATAYAHGDTGYVICYEEIDGQFLVATNVFVREGRIWKLIHHQAGPTAAVPLPEEGEEPDAVN